MIDRVKDINANEIILQASNGYTKSYGTGMADMGGFETVDICLIDKKDMVSKEGTKYYSLKEIDEEYLQYLRLKQRYGNKE